MPHCWESHATAQMCLYIVRHKVRVAENCPFDIDGQVLLANIGSGTIFFFKKIFQLVQDKINIRVFFCFFFKCELFIK